MQFPHVIRAKGEGRRSATLFLIMRLLSKRSIKALSGYWHKYALDGRRE